MKKLIIMHGCPGSGKSTLATKIYDQAINQKLTAIICSTDNHFLDENGVYKFNAAKLGYNHECNQLMVKEHTELGTDVIIVDNTNITAKECKPYVKIALEADYCIYFMEPITDWKFDIDELVKRNTHGVPRESIQKMLDRWQDTDDICEKLAEELSCDYDLVSESMFKELE